MRYLPLTDADRVPVACGENVTATEQVASTHGAAVILGADGRPGQRIWWSQPECPVGTVAVVMLDVDPKDLLEVAAPDDQQPVQALSADVPIHRSA